MARLKKKKVLIIVHGVWSERFRFKNKRIESIRQFLLRLFGTERGIKRKDYHKLASYLEQGYDVVEFLKWDGGLFKNKDIEPAIKKLIKLVDKYRSYDIDIIAVSMGGLITQKALENLGDLKVKNLLYLGAVHSGKHSLKNVEKTFNIYSTMDKVFFWANDLYEGLGNAFIKGENVVNLSMPNLKHQDLCQNKKLDIGDFKDKSLFEIYKEILGGSIPFISDVVQETKNLKSSKKKY